MKQLIQHLLKNNFDEILEKSLLNCHCKGLHSIMLLDSPGKTIRLYICTPDHEMHKNHPSMYKHTPMSVSFHAHHCNLTLHCVKGEFLNWCVAPAHEGPGFIFEATKYRYHSKIKEGELKFERLASEIRMQSIHKKRVFENETIHLEANEIHTVACLEGKVSAWLVYEGKEDESYDSVLYANSDLNAGDYCDFYMKPTKQQVYELLELSGLI